MGDSEGWDGFQREQDGPMGGPIGGPTGGPMGEPIGEQTSL